jgi:WD40 repeat protein
LTSSVKSASAREWAAFSPDGKTFVTSNDDGTARMWDMDYHDTIDYPCSNLLRDFTAEERAQYQIMDDNQPVRNHDAAPQPEN